MPRLFDPLNYLLHDIRATVELNRDGCPVLGFDARHSPQQVQQARRILATHGRLIALQLREGGVSVQKLLARGVIRLEGGRYELAQQSGRPEGGLPRPSE